MKKFTFIWLRVLVRLPIMLLTLVASIAVAQDNAPEHPRILVLAAAPVQAGKLERLKPLAQQAGFNLEYRMLDGLQEPLTPRGFG